MKDKKEMVVVDGSVSLTHGEGSENGKRWALRVRLPGVIGTAVEVRLSPKEFGLLMMGVSLDLLIEYSSAIGNRIK